MTDENIEKYYLIAARNPDRMLLYSMPDLPEDMDNDWVFGQPFTVELNNLSM